MLEYFVFCSILVLAQGYDHNVITEGFELKYVQVITRSPEHSPSEEFFDISQSLNINLTIQDFQPYGYDQVYPKGKERMYKTGESLKKRYSDFLSKKYEIEVLSYDYNPGKHGILIAEEGLKGTPYDQIRDKTYTNEELDKPFKEELINDIIYPFDHIDCPAYEEEMSKTEEKDKEILKQFKESLTAIDQEFGGYEYIQSYFILHEMYRMHIEAGKKMPHWFKKSQKVMKEMLGKFVAIDVSSTKLKQLNGGRYTSHILKEVDNVKTGSSQPKMVLLCVSPHMLRSLIGALGGEKGYKPKSSDHVNKFPEYGAMFVIEVYEKQGKGTYHIRFLYKNVKDNYERIILDGCPELCEIGRLKKLLGKVPLTEDELKKVCEVEKKAPPKK